MQLQNASKQRENFKMQLGESRDELRKNKETRSLLQKEVLEIQKQAEDSKGELAAKMRQVEKLETANKDLVSRVEDLKEQLSKQRMSMELHATQSKVVETERNLSQVKITELDTSLQSIKTERDNLQRELFAVSSKLTTMEEANRKSLDKVAELDQENSRLRDNIAGLESDMFAQDKRFSQLEPTYVQAKDEIEQLTIKLEESTIRISQLESSYETAIRERDDVREELTLSERRIADTKSLLQKTEDASNEVEQKLAAMKSQMLKYEGQIESASKQKTNFKAELEEERSKVTRLKRELTKTQGRFEELQKNLESNKKDSGNKDEIIEELRASVTAYELKTESLYSEVSKLQAQMEITEEEKRELQEETLDAQKRIRDVTADNRQSSEENEKLNLEMQSFYKRLSELQASYNACEHEKYDFQHQAMALQQQVTKLEAELEEAVNQRSTCEVRMQEYSATYSAVNQEATLLKTQLLEHQRVNDELHKKTAEGDASLQQLHEKLNALNVDFDACRDELTNVKGMREMSENEKKMLHNQLMAKQEEHLRTQSLYETTLKRKQQLEADYLAAQKTIANMEPSLKRSVAAEKARELDHERSRSSELAKELASYKTKVSSLESISALTKNDVQGVLDELEETENKMTILKQELEEAVANKEERMQKLRILEKRNSELEQEVLACRQVKEKAEEEIHIMRTRIAKYESQIETIQDQRTQLKDQLDEINTKLTFDKDNVMRLESKVTEEKKINETANKAILRKDQQLEELQMKIRSAEAELEKAKSELMSFKVATEGLRAEKSEYEGRLGSYKERLEQREQEVFALRDSVMKLEQELSTSKFKIVSLEAQVSSLHLDKTEYKTQWESSQTAITKMKKELKVCQNEVQEKNRACESLSLELKEKDIALEKAINDKVALETEVTALQQDLDSLERNYERSQSRAKELEDSLDVANESISRLELSSFHDESGELEKTSDEKVWEVEALYKQSQDRERSLRQKIDDHKNKIKRLEAENKAAHQENLGYSRENGALQTKIQEYELAIDKYDQEKKNLKEELVTLHSKLTDLEVKYDYEIREKDSVKRHLESALQRVSRSRDEFLKNDKQLIQQRIGADAMKKEMDEKELLMDQLRASKLYLEESIETLRHTLAESREDCERTKLEKERLQQEILSLTTSKADYETRIQKVALERDRLITENQSAMAKVALLEQENMEQNREKQTLCGKVEEWKNSSLLHQGNQTSADQRIANLEGTIDILKTDAIKKEGEVRELQAKNTNLEREADSFKKKLHTVEMEYRELIKRHQSLEVRSKSLSRNQASDNATAAFQEKIQNLEREVMMQRRKIAELEASSRAFLEKEAELQENLFASRTLESQWESKYDAIRARKNEIEQDLIALQKEFTPLKDDHRHSVVKLETVNTEIREARKKILKLEMEISSAQNARMQLEQQVQEYIEMLKNRDDELLTTQRTLQEARVLLEHKGLSVAGKESLSTEHVVKENEKLEKDIFVLRQELISTQSLLTAATRERDEAGKEVFNIKRTVTEMQGKLNTSQQHIQELQNSVDVWQRKMTTSEAGQQKAIIEQVTLRSQLDEANQRMVYSKEEFFETQRELFSLRALVKNYKKELAKNDSWQKEQSTKIKLLEDELRSSKLRIDCGRDDYNSISQELARLKLQVDEKDKSILVTEDNAKKLLEENNRLRLELSDSQALESRHKQNWNDSKHKTDFLQEEIMSLRQKISYLDTQNSTKEEELRDSKKELLALKKSNFGFKSKYESLQRQTRELQAELSMAKAKRSIVQPDESTLLTEKTAGPIEESVSRHNSTFILKNEEHVRDISRWEEKVLDLDSKLSESRRQKEKLECEVIWRTRRIEDLEGRILKDSKQQDYSDGNTLQLNVDSLQQELDASKNTIKRLEKYRDTYEEKIKVTEEKLRVAEQKALQMEAAYLSSQESCDLVHKKFLETQKRLSVIETSPERRESLDDVLKGLLRQEDEVKRLIDEARKSNGNLREELARTERTRKESDVMLTGNKASNSLQIDRLKTELSQLRDDYQRVYKEKQNLSAEFQKLELQISSWEKSYNDIKQENDNLHFELSVLQKRFSQLQETAETVKQDGCYVSLVDATARSSEMQQLKEEKGKLNGEVASLNILLSSYKEKLDSLYSEKLQLHAKLEESQKKLFNLEQTNSTLIAEKSRLEQVSIANKISNVGLEKLDSKKDTAEILELRIDLEKVSRERDYLQHMLELHKSRDNYDKGMQLERVHAQTLADKDGVINDLRGETAALQLEVGKLKQEQSFIHTEHRTLRTKYMDILKERDCLQKQFLDYKLNSGIHASLETNSSIDSYRREIEEKNVLIDNLRTETIQLQTGIESAKKELAEKSFLSQRQSLQVEDFKREAESLRAVLADNVKENGTLKLKLNDICKERDFLFKNKCSLEFDLSVSRKKMSEAQNLAMTANSRKDQELSIVQNKYAKLENNFKEVKQENETMKLEMELQVKTELWSKQECIYELEREARKLKAENDYHERVMEEKNTNLSKLRLQIASSQKEIGKLEKELFVTKEAYEKSERRMREIFKCEHELLTIEDLRCLVSASPVLSVRSWSAAEHSFTGRKVTEDHSLSLSSIHPSLNP